MASEVANIDDCRRRFNVRSYLRADCGRSTLLASPEALKANGFEVRLRRKTHFCRRRKGFSRVREGALY